MPLLQHEQFHEHDHIGVRIAALVGVTLVERGQPGTKPLPVNQTLDLIERVTTGRNSRIFLVEKEVPERAHPERSIEEWIEVSWGLSLFSTISHHTHLVRKAPLFWQSNCNTSTGLGTESMNEVS